MVAVYVQPGQCARSIERNGNSPGVMTLFLAPPPRAKSKPARTRKICPQGMITTTTVKARAKAPLTWALNHLATT